MMKGKTRNGAGVVAALTLPAPLQLQLTDPFSLSSNLGVNLPLFIPLVPLTVILRRPRIRFPMLFGTQGAVVLVTVCRLSRAVEIIKRFFKVTARAGLHGHYLADLRKKIEFPTLRPGQDIS